MIFGFFNFFEKTTENTQKIFLRNRYYENLSVLESLAYYYGELGFLAKGFLYTLLGAGWIASAVVFYNPIALTILTVVLALLFFLDYQYNIMNARFEHMVKDIELSENQLIEASTLTFELENQARNCIEKNTEIVNHLQETREKIEGTYSRLLSIEQQVENAYNEAESAVVRISSKAQEIIKSNDDLSLTLEKSKQELSKLSSIFSVDESIADTKKILEESKAFRVQTMLRLNTYVAENQNQLAIK